jgi:hypothetical protein
MLGEFESMNSPRHLLTRDLVLHRSVIIFLLWFFGQATKAQDSEVAGGQPAPSALSSAIFNYLNMAGTETAANFKPLTQSERTRRYSKSLINPIMYFKAALSAGIDHANDKPYEWEQSASGYGKRIANITGQYAIQRTVTFGLASLLHEDNRYFGSGKKSFWPRTGYAISSSVLARGRQREAVSFSLSDRRFRGGGVYFARVAAS